MIPWAHAGIGYLLWSGVTHLWDDRPPDDREAWALLLGTQFPDLVDKPLAWSLDVLPSGRSLGHSLLTAAAIFAVGYVLSRRGDRTNLVWAFSVGHVSHSLADTYRLLLTGQYEYLSYLLYPVLPAPTYDANASFSTYLQGVSLGRLFGFQLLIAVLVAALWVYDGTPGLPWKRARVAEKETTQE